VRLADFEADVMVREADADGDGRISYGMLVDVVTFAHEALGEGPAGLTRWLPRPVHGLIG
jgi:hypothetical protein